jgi:16S rRNA (uracil1498-N3)-methyltransferase
LQCAFDERPPPKRPVGLVVCLPRPPVLRRVLQHATALGVDAITLLQSARVEKSYWHSPSVRPEAIAEQLHLGLEQAVDTRPPAITLAPRFRPFVEDVLSVAEAEVLVADPRGEARCPVDVVGRTILVVGPEGGFVPFELEMFERIGATLVGLGPRVLRVETAVVALLGRLG